MCNGNCGMCPRRMNHVKSEVSRISKMWIVKNKGEDYFSAMKQEDFVKMVDLLLETEGVKSYSAVLEKDLIDAFKQVTGEDLSEI